MVLMHAGEHGEAPPRISTDLDVPVDVQVVTGGTQAPARTQLLPVPTPTRRGLVPRPSLPGALVVKADAVGVDDAPQAQQEDFVVLLALVDDPFDLAGDLTPGDRERIRSRSELAHSSEAVWRALTPEQADRATAALRILWNW